MKNKVWLLTKIQLMRVWNPEFFKGREELRKKRKRFLLLSLGMVGIGALIMFYSALLSFGFVQMGMGDAIPIVMMGVCSLFLIAISFMKSGSTLFGGKNFDMILSLPVTVRQVVLSKILLFYGTDFLVFLAGFLPASIVYAVNMKPGVGEVFNLLVAVVLGPCIPVILSLVLSILVMLLAERLPHKEIFVIVLNVAIFVGILFWTGNISATMDKEALMNMGKALVNGVIFVYPPAGVAFSFLEEGSIWGTLLFSVLSIVLFWGFVTLVSSFYVKINEMFSSKSRTVGKVTYGKESTIRKALLKKEWRRLFSCPIYAMNTLVGYVLMILFGIMVLTMKADTLEGMINIPGIEDQFGGVFPFIIAMFAGIAPMTAPSLSLEGKSRWIMCSLPVKSIEIFRAKITLNLLFAVPSILLCSFCVWIKFPGTAADNILLFVLPIAFSVFTAVFGMVVNVNIPRYDWTQEIQAVKNSASVLICVFTGMFAALTPLMIVMALPAFREVISWSFAIVSVGLSAGLWKWLKKVRLWM
ncbi:MAG: hypothetical protein Q4B37_04255 [Eubacteriales bacterium]|nr:hypothetical protein [Eubacteriales bacterium]